MSRVLVLVVVLVNVAGCDAGAKPTPPPPLHLAAVPLPAPVTVPPVPPPTTALPQHVLLASIDRGPCYGTCPVYKVTVYRDGKVEYVGTDYVKNKGKAAGTVTAEQLAALDKLFTDDHYLAYKDSYEHEDFTDASSAQTSYAPLGASTTKYVRHYYGDTHAPESLTKLEEDFDTIVNTDRWIGTRVVHDKLNGR
ncbi:MAG: DUF6438 domain-containing protein [Deltaproteobacteria bacterium]